MYRKIICLFIFGAVFAALLFCSQPSMPVPKGGTRYGSSDRSEILDKKYYIISYRPQYGVAEWTMYETDHDKVHSQNVKRYMGPFRTDPDASVKVSHSDYTQSGYDRGHLVPCNDMQWSASSMMSTFYMTNVAPQTHEFNSGIWKTLENMSEQLTSKYDRLWVITGAVLDRPAQKFRKLPVADRRIVIPRYFYKIFAAYDADDNPVAVAYLIPQNATGKDPGSYIVSVDRIEELTGLDFFADFTQKTQISIESTPNMSFSN